MVAVLVSRIGVLVASVLVSDLVGSDLVCGLVLVVSVSLLVSVSVSMTVLLLQREAVRAGAMVSLMAMRVIVLVTMSGIGAVSGVTRVIRVARVFLELNVSALVAAVVLVVLGHKVLQLLAMHLRLETLVLVGGVVDSALVAIGIDQLVVSSHLVSVAMFAVLLHIASLFILDAILEVVLGMRVMLVVVVAMMIVMVMGSLLLVIVVRHEMHGGMTGGRLMIMTMEGGCLDQYTGQQGEGCEYLQEDKDHISLLADCRSLILLRSYHLGHGAAAD